MVSISVVIPVYNTDKRKIKRCINSLVNQMSPCYELVIIDDGSKNDVADFIDILCDDIPYSRVFHTKNRGVSAARNLGVENCSGDYIMFVDADDVVTDNAIRDASYIIRESSVDIVYGMVKYTIEHDNMLLSPYEKDIIPDWSLVKEEYIQNLITHFISLGCKDLWCGDMYISRGPIARVVKRELALSVPFKEDITLGEDAIWNIELLRHTHRVAVVKSLWYYYVHNSLSATHKFRGDSVKNQITFINSLISILDDEKKYAASILEKKLDCIQDMVTQYYEHLLPKYGSIKVNKCFNEMLKKIGWLSCSYGDFFSMRIKYKIKYLIFAYAIFPVDICKKIREFKFRKV